MSTFAHNWLKNKKLYKTKINSKHHNDVLVVNRT